MEGINRKLLITGNPFECRAALLENNVPVEFFVERSNDLGLVGNIYKGVVARVLPGMQAAFIDIGLEKSAFLYVNEVIPDNSSLLAEDDELGEPQLRPRGKERIENLLQQGQEILVQVSKDPIGTKGARLTSNISLPGRFLVYLPLVDHVGVSKKIEREAERQRLKDYVLQNRPTQVGFIVRTVCDGARVTKLKSDMEYLAMLWEDILKRQESVSGPELIHQELTLPLRLVRDILSDEVDELVMDHAEIHRDVLRFVQKFMPRQKKKIVLDQDNALPLFERYGLELEIERSLERKIWLKSGGYIVIDPTEALVSIDVNTGKYVGTASQEETILKTNLEAVKEIAYQLRLRNIGGLIVIDLIDMPRESDRTLVHATLLESLRNDRARSKVLKFSELGLVEMSRKRVRESLNQVLMERCPYCHGKGLLKSATTLAHAIFRQACRELNQQDQASQVLVHAHPAMIDAIYSEERELLDHLETTYKISVVFRPEDGYHVERFKVVVQ